MSSLVILVNGEAPSHPVALQALDSADYLVCSDGAYQTAVELSKSCDLVVGDGDSLSESHKISLGTKWVHIAEQDTNDLDKAFRTALERFPAVTDIVILGAGGLREDHFLGNLFRLPGFLKRAPLVRINMITNAGVFTVFEGLRKFDSVVGESVSVFAPHSDTKVFSSGLVWPLDGVNLSELWCGTLNRTSSTSFSLNSDKPVILYRPH